MKTFAENLLGITKECRHDMCNPQEQKVSAYVIGDYLNNLHGDKITVCTLINREHELIISIDKGEESKKFNLATMIALARIGAQKILEENK